MYIIHETLASDDPRVHPEMVTIGDYWHFTISYITPNKGIYIDWLPHEKLAEDVAKSYPLTNAYKGVVSLSKPFTKKEDMVTASGDVEWKKYVYKLTSKDKENVVLLIKAAMRLFAKAHLADGKTLTKLLKEITTLNTLEDCDLALYNYYGIGSATVHGLQRQPKFNITWPWDKK